MEKVKFLNAIEEILSITQNSLLENDVLENFQDWDSIAF
ncbi:acyl carrier protein, partial [Campylobacter jejuni]|nr:acyl carrier protein [Campylobacter jejuni]